MGTLIGHVAPGTFFIIFGLWWTWCVFHRYFLSRQNTPKNEDKQESRRNFKYKSTASFNLFPCHRFPVEGILKVMLSTSGILGEILTAYKDGKLVNYGNLQHISMHTFFWLNGLMDILTFYKLNLIPDLDYLTGIMAFVIETLLFLFHLVGQSAMEARVHTLLIYVAFGSAFSVACEMMYRNSVLPALSRAYFTLLQGTWFYQTTLISYVYHWSSDSEDLLKFTTFVFAIHAAAVFLFVLFAGYLIRFRVTRMKRFQYAIFRNVGPELNKAGSNDEETPILEDSEGL